MMLMLNMVIFHIHVCLPDGTWTNLWGPADLKAKTVTANAPAVQGNQKPFVPAAPGTLAQLMSKHGMIGEDDERYERELFFNIYNF